MTICYFTASGNCLYVAKKIGGTLLSIPQLMRKECIELSDEAVGIVCPVYAVEMPMMVRKFIDRAKITTDYFFFVYTYGMGYAEAFSHAKIAADKAGLQLKYVNAIQMVDNYLPIFDMQEQMETLAQKDVEGQIARLCKDISMRKTIEIDVTDEKRAVMEKYKKELAEPILRKDTALGYIVNEKCVRCGICAKVCPANNITVTDTGVEFAEHCEVCYACLHNCPKNAIHLKKEANTVRFRNEHVTLADIIKANG